MTTQDFMLSYKRALLAKTESLYNRDASPNAASNAILISDLELQPLLAEEVQRTPLRAHFGAPKTRLSGMHAEIAFSVDFAAAGQASRKPAWAHLVKACGFTETYLSANAGWRYNPLSENASSLTLYAYMDKSRHILTGCRGTFSILLEAQEFPQFRFQFRGQYQRPSTSTFPATANTQSFIEPEIPSATSIPTFRFASQTLGVERFRFDLNNSFPYDVRLNEAQVNLIGRNSEGRMTCRDPGLETTNLFESAENAQTNPLTIQIGAQAGRRIILAFPKVQIKPPRYESNEVQSLNFAMSFQPENGNDEISLTVR